MWSLFYFELMEACIPDVNLPSYRIPTYPSILRFATVSDTHSSATDVGTISDFEGCFEETGYYNQKNGFASVETDFSGSPAFHFFGQEISQT